MRKVLHVEVSGCNECPAYTYREEDDCNSAQHNCEMGACNFPEGSDFSAWPRRIVDNGYFPSDCPLKIIQENS